MEITDRKIRSIWYTHHAGNPHCDVVGENGVAEIIARIENFGDHGLLFYDVYGPSEDLILSISGRAAEGITYSPRQE